MNRSVRLPHIQYGQEEAAELQRASLSVQHIFNKTQKLVDRYMPDSLWTSWTGLKKGSGQSARLNEAIESGIFQKWIKSPKGWKCIGCEHYGLSGGEPKAAISGDMLSFGEGADDKAADPGYGGRALQMMIWSQFEKITLLRPFLGSDPFFTDEELDVISRYFVPTYLSPMPLQERGKEFKIKNLRSGIPLYQEKITAPSLEMRTGGTVLHGSWMTGVDLSSQGFAGLRPYLKVPEGGRTYMKALIV
ncbi:hypothetical protein [Paenibacillus sp. DMB20]|uniref:hypothetical protein n=1 Tax=Paenibacillus sp. DMB20 TaxID=1642570 RepID=UPI0006276AB7|nr:hypothetical protein [Paenibacillus sp. DMB20]KKO52120.1 hypothetical protein XI25_21955 [Paenibacillus sp. DMB20]